MRLADSVFATPRSGREYAGQGCGLQQKAGEGRMVNRNWRRVLGKLGMQCGSAA